MDRTAWAAACALLAILAIPAHSQAQTIGTNRSIDPVVVPLTLKPVAVALGQWPEGMAWDGAALWIAESGVQRIARFDPAAGRIAETLRVGRLPVEMASAADGTIYSLVHTDKRVFSRTRAGKAGVVSGVAGCPEHMALGGGTILVLTLPQCSSEDAQLVAIDTANGRSRTSASLGRDAFAVAAAAGHAWVMHNAGAIDVVDIASLANVTTIKVEGVARAIGASEAAIYVVGQERQGEGAPIALRIDAATRAVSHRRILPGNEAIVAIAPAGRHIVVASEKNALFVLSADDLAVKARITLDSGWAGRTPQSLLVVGDRLYITTQAGVGDNGTLLILEGWRP